MVQKAMKKTKNASPKDRASTEVRHMGAGRPTSVQALISFRAYEFYIARGYEPGRDVDDWLRAEAEVMRQRINTLAM